MRSHRVQMVFLAAAVCSVALVSCSHKGRVIPESKLTDIYAEIFLSDQWLSSHYTSRKQADTTLFYEPIFRKYGYTVKDYDASVKHYIKKPDDYAKILKSAALKLDNKAKYLHKVEDYYSARKKVVSSYEPKEFSLETLMPEDTMMTWHIADTLQQADTLSGAVDLAVVTADSLAVSVDSAAVVGEAAVAQMPNDTLAHQKIRLVRDSIKFKKIRKENE